MIIDIVNTVRCSVDSNGNVTILSSTNQILPVANESFTDSFIVTESQKKYNYITLGKYSQIQLLYATPITVKYEKTIAKLRTHKTQLNRIDKMKPFLENFQVGDEVKVTWDTSSNILTLSK